MSSVLPISRGCGTRVPGGLYAEVDVSSHGVPIERFLCDPPIPVNLAALGLSFHGVHPLPQGEVCHLADGVGLRDYANVADFLEEVSRFGLSRRVPSTFNFGLLTRESLLVLFHARAWVDNPSAYYAPRDGSGFSGCPTGVHAGEALAEPTCCAGIWWDDLEGGVPAPSESEGRRVLVHRPSFTYRGRRAPDEVRPQYRPAIFARFPVSRFVVIHDAQERQHEPVLRRLRRFGLDAHVVSE